MDPLEEERQFVENEINKLNSDRVGPTNYWKSLPENIPENLNQRVVNLLTELNDYGIFIVPLGELEQWLKVVPDLDAAADQFLKMLNRIDNSSPTRTDIWKFIDDINKWISNKNRKGMLAWKNISTTK